MEDLKENINVILEEAFPKEVQLEEEHIIKDNRAKIRDDIFEKKVQIKN